MQIESARLHNVRIPFKQAFQHALKERTLAEAVIVVLRSQSGKIGLGEIVPRPYLTGETLEGVFDRSAPERARKYVGKSFSSREDVVAFLRGELEAAGRELATLGGFELALLDLAGKEMEFEASEILGSALGPELPPGVVLGFEVQTSELKKQCALLRFAGKRHVKVKVGLPDDMERLEIVSATLGAGASLRLDANGAWSVEQAIERIRAITARFEIESVEQPVASSDLSALHRVRAETGVKVMADESLCTLEDGQRLIAAGAADIFNIRIGKCGGMLGSLRLVELARSAGLGLHLGALVGETAVLSRAGELFGRRVAGFACLEGKHQNRFLLRGDIAKDAEESFGFGLALDREALQAFQHTEKSF